MATIFFDYTSIHVCEVSHAALEVHPELKRPDSQVELKDRVVCLIPHFFTLLKVVSERVKARLILVGRTDNAKCAHDVAGKAPCKVDVVVLTGIDFVVAKYLKSGESVDQARFISRHPPRVHPESCVERMFPEEPLVADGSERNAKFDASGQRKLQIVRPTMCHTMGGDAIYYFCSSKTRINAHWQRLICQISFISEATGRRCREFQSEQTVSLKSAFGVIPWISDDLIDKVVRKKNGHTTLFHRGANEAMRLAVSLITPDHFKSKYPFRSLHYNRGRFLLSAASFALPLGIQLDDGIKLKAFEQTESGDCSVQ